MRVRARADLTQERVAADERAQIIEMEKQMRAERLGLVPKTRRDPGNQLVDHELEVRLRARARACPSRDQMLNAAARRRCKRA